MHFDLSRDKLTRPNRPPISLRRELFVRILEELMRNLYLSIPGYLLLLRQKQAESDRDPRPPANSFRHDLSHFHRRRDEMDIPIDTYRDDQVIRAHYDPMLLGSNVLDAELLVKRAAARLVGGHVGNAIEFAGRALALDYDCTRATSLVAQFLQSAPDHLTADLVVRTEFCLARGMLGHASAVQRLRNKTGIHPDLAAAMTMAQSHLISLRQQWVTLGSWPFDSRSQDQAGRDYRLALREFLEVVIDARRGSPFDFNQFAQNPLFAPIVDHLLGGRLKDTGARGQNEVRKNLQVEILTKLIATAWHPTPVTSPHEFRDQVSSFLIQKRIARGSASGRSRRAEFRDDQYKVDDRDEQRNDDNGDDDDE